MKRSEKTTEALDPEVERELDAVERALAGLAVDDDLAAVASFATELRAERPEPDPDWASELDQRAAGGFAGRRPRAGTGGFGEWIGGLRPGSLLGPVGGLATLAIVVAVGIGVTAGEHGSDDSATTGVAQTTAQPAAPVSSSDDAAVAGGTGGGAVAAEKVAPEQLESLDPELPESASNADSRDYLRRQDKTAPGKDKRQQDRSARLSLRTDTKKVREVSDEAIQITESAGGVVLSSELSESGSTASANLQLSIPTRELDGTLDQLTDLATVSSLNEASVDITKPFVSAQDDLEDARAERQKLLDALAKAEDGPEADSIRAQLDDVRKEISRAEAAFGNIARRARLSQVSLTIHGSPNGDDDGNWSLGDAADDALGALKTVAGVMLVGAAIVLPIAALIALLSWLGLTLRHRRRESALDD